MAKETIKKLSGIGIITTISVGSILSFWYFDRMGVQAQIETIKTEQTKNDGTQDKAIILADKELSERVRTLETILPVLQDDIRVIKSDVKEILKTVK
jgi:hypothetical protein